MKRTLLLTTLLALGGVATATAPTALSLSTAHAAKPAPVDAGLAVMVAGDVSYKGSKGGAQPVTPFQKVRVGDKLLISEGGRVELVYFNGRKEVWTGPATVRVSEEQGQVEKGDAEAEVAEMDRTVGRSLESLPVMLRRAELDRAGATLVRGARSEQLALDEVEKAQVAEAEEVYAQMRGATTAEDILPEMFLASVYLRFGLNAEAEGVLGKAVEACGGCEKPQQLLSWVQSQ